MNKKNNSTLVMKFGGTSVGTPEAMSRAVENVRRALTEWQSIVVVTSALSGITDILLESAERAIQGDSQFISRAEVQIREKHFAIADKLVVDLASQAQVKGEIRHLITEFLNLCQAITILGEATPRALDAIGSLGERMSVRLLSASIEASGIPSQFIEATQLIITDDCFQAAHPDIPKTEDNIQRVLKPVLVNGRVPVVTGFVSASYDGVTTTLGRGGSDYSAAILGAALPADEVWILTDVDGVMTADPRMVADARTIDRLSYREVAELAYFGAKVLHPKTIRPVIEAGIPVRVCNTFNPDHAGTRVVENGTTHDNGNGPDGIIKAITAIRGQRLVTVEGRGMLGVPGVAARTFNAVAVTGTSVPLITQASSEQSICFALPAESTDTVLESLKKEFTTELVRRDIDRIWATDLVVIISVVGAGMKHTPGIAGRIFSALGDKNVNVIAIAQGSSEVSISLVVDANEAEPAVRSLHELIL